MPVTEAIKPTGGVRRKNTENAAENLSKKRSGRMKESTDEIQSRGDDLSSPVIGNKKSVGKKGAIDNGDKKAKNSLPDKVPKKTVQRAKGSVALNKTIDSEDKKKALNEMEVPTARNSTTMIKDPNENIKVKAARSKIRQSAKSNRPGSEKRISSGKTKNWTTVVKKKSETTVTTEEEIVDVEPPVTKTEEIQRENVPLSSCSFFEKLQQGVRAYFGSRNSLMEEKSKKKVTEGGIQTGAGVAKEGKEESKGRTQDDKKINKIKYSDIHLFYDRPRLKSNSGGQMNYILHKKPKILPYVKSKKLHHPKNKNSCVRIQIPRKGYFYRSFEFRPNQSASQPWKRLESTSLPKKSEVQVARMAATGSEGSDIHKKGVEKCRLKTSNAKENCDEDSMAYDYLEALNFILNNQMVAQKFEKEVNRLALNWPTETFFSPENINFLSEEGKKLLPGKHGFERDKKSWVTPQKSWNSSATEIQKQDDYIQIETSESYAILEAQIRNSTSCFKAPQQLKYVSDPSFDTLMQCLRGSLGEEKPPYGALEISTVTTRNGNIKSNFTQETLPEFESISKSKNAKTDTFYKNSSAEAKSPPKLEKSEETFAKILIGDIDLHSEFQNYLKKTKKGKMSDKENVYIQNKNDHQSFGLNERDTFTSTKSFDLYPDANQAPNVKSHFNRNSEIKSSSEEILTVGTNLPQMSVRTRSSENLSSHFKNGLKQIDSNEVSQKSSCIETADNTTESPLLHLNANEKLVSYLMTLLFKKHNEQLTTSLDYYEKVSPMRINIGTKKKKSKLLHSNSVDSMSTEQSMSKIRNTKSESNKFLRSEYTEADKKLKTEEDAIISQLKNGKKWCPTLDELVDIYSCILKQSSKKKSSQMTRNSWFSSIISTLKDKLNEKQNKVDLINFTKTLRECFKLPSDWTRGVDSNRQKKLQEYVNMFQEILLSSLSIEQISYLNSVISQLQEEGKESSPEFSEFQNIQETENFNSDDKIMVENVTPISTSFASPQKNVKKEDWKPPENTSASLEYKKSLNEKSSIKKIKPVKQPVKVALSTPTALEKVLKSTFNSENVRKKRKPTDKILVNVKLCGSQVLVNDFSFIHNERFLRATPPTRNRVSELIIENITSDKLSEASLSDLNTVPSQTKKNSEKSIKTNRNIKIVVKSTKLKHQKSRRRLKTKNEESHNSDKENYVDGLKTSVPGQKCESVTSVEAVPSGEHEPLMKSKQSFEYNQEQLKAQHPINAIVETSESKIMESVESIENIPPNKKLPTETKRLDPSEAAETKELQNKSLEHNFFSKVLLRDLGWNNYAAQKDLVRTGSQNINLSQPQNLNLIKDSKDNVKFLDDLQFKPRNEKKKSKKAPSKQQNMYFCYPSVVLKEESVKKNKKSKEPDLKLIKTSGSKVIKKADLKVVNKTSSKGMRNTNSKGVKTTPSKGVKQVDSKGISKTNSKVTKKKELKEGAKKSGKLPTFSSQVAASERLAKRPERFYKPVRTQSKQKENICHSKKASVNKTNIAKAPKLSEDSILYIRKTSDISSESSSFNASTESSNHDWVSKQKQKSQIENFNKMTSSSDATDGVDKFKNVPVVIYSTSDDSDYVTSQFAIIRSDSILKTLSRSPISLNKINSVFKSHSDVKFYPGRIPDGSEEQEQPWVTFILTPQQLANAELPDYQVKIVDKHNLAEERKCDDFENEQIPLNSIEKFIDELKESRLKLMRQQKELEKLKNGRKKLSSTALVKQNINWSSSKLLKNTAESDSQNSRINIHSEKETVLAKVVVSILQFLLNQKDKEMELNQTGTSKDQQTDENFKSGYLQSRVTDGANDDACEKWRMIEKTTSEMLNTVINDVLESERLLEKSKLIRAIKDELEERGTNSEGNVDGLLELSKKVEAIKSLEKLNIETSKNDFSKETEEQKVFFPMPTKGKKTAESLLPIEEVESLERKSSIYFDAEEKVEGEIEECVNQLEYQSGEPFPKTVSEDSGENETEAKDRKSTYPKGLFSASNENLLSTKTIGLKTEKAIFNKIYSNLRKNDVFYSIILFDILLKKKGVLVKDEEVQNVLQTVNQKSKNVITEIEKSAWVKLDFLLEQVSELYNMESQEENSAESACECVTQQLNKTLAFIGNIQIINTKVADLQNFLSQKKICSDFDLNNIFSKFFSRLNQLKNTIILKLSCSATRFFENENFGDGAGCEIRPLKPAQNLTDIIDDLEKESQIQNLKNQIKDQRLLIEFLINTGSGSVSSEMENIKNRVSEKIRKLERTLFNNTGDENVRNPSQESLLASLLHLDQTSSILSLTKTCTSWGIVQYIKGNVNSWK